MVRGGAEEARRGRDIRACRAFGLVFAVLLAAAEADIWRSEQTGSGGSAQHIDSQRTNEQAPAPERNLSKAAVLY
ncbi:hypothetical protein FNAPI_6710 [Fusarium napiforme]|uniref:Uncharacterized protein n=1 Tax=Fusarium napiforme TaxID=42672 RepID=A0A8H5JDS8_9HYPO|nr:hypothetical protein FNAPI_6710 [Fusarium napiforme]